MIRNPQLDALRAIAVFLVLGHHLAFNQIWHDLGWTGVDLFFVLSGYLISGLLFREYLRTGGIRIGRFLVRRGLKIYPAYYLLLLITVTYCYQVGRVLSLKTILTDALFIQSYHAGIWTHLWSLAIEEHFYIALPLVLWLLIRRRTADPLRPVPYLCAGIMATSLALRIAHYLSGAPFDDYSAYTPTHLRMDELAFGVLLCYVHQFHPRVIESLLRWRGRPLLAAGLLALCPVFLLGKTHPFTYTAGFTLLGVGYGAILIYSLHIVPPHLFWVGGLARIGQYSYSIYLLHMVVLEFLRGREWSIPLTVVVYLIGGVSLGILAAIFIEQPVLRLREQLFPATAAPSLDPTPITSCEPVPTA